MFSAFILNYTGQFRARRCLLSGCRVPQKWRSWRHLRLLIYSLSNSHFCACNFFLFNVSVCPFSVPSFSVHSGRMVGSGQLIRRDMNEPVRCHKPVCCCCSCHMCLMLMFVNVCVKYKTSKSHRPYKANSWISSPALAPAKLKRP